MVPDRSHGGYWRVVAAVVGFLIATAYTALARAPEGQGVPEPSPAVEGQAHGGAPPGYRPPEPPPVPIRIIRMSNVSILRRG